MVGPLRAGTGWDGCIDWALSLARVRASSLSAASLTACLRMPPWLLPPHLLAATHHPIPPQAPPVLQRRAQRAGTRDEPRVAAGAAACTGGHHSSGLTDWAESAWHAAPRSGLECMHERNRCVTVALSTCQTTALCLPRVCSCLSACRLCSMKAEGFLLHRGMLSIISGGEGLCQAAAWKSRCARSGMIGIGSNRQVRDRSCK